MTVIRMLHHAEHTLSHLDHYIGLATHPHLPTALTLAAMHLIAGRSHS